MYSHLSTKLQYKCKEECHHFGVGPVGFLSQTNKQTNKKKKKEKRRNVTRELHDCIWISQFFSGACCSQSCNRVYLEPGRLERTAKDVRKGLPLCQRFTSSYNNADIYNLEVNGKGL